MPYKVLFLAIFVDVFHSINGCGPLPLQQARTINYEVTGFKLPAEMVFSVDNSDPSRVPTISTSEQQAVAIVQNTITRSVEHVLYQQGRGAGLPDDVISLIFNQLDITVKYTPLQCIRAFTDETGMGIVIPLMTNCQIISGTVTKTCMPAVPTTTKGAGKQPQKAPQPMCEAMMLEDIDPKHLTISGSITTTNVIMANWSTQMWQSVLNRVLRSVASGPLASHFIGASINLK